MDDGGVLMVLGVLAVVAGAAMGVLWVDPAAEPPALAAAEGADVVVAGAGDEVVLVTLVVLAVVADAAMVVGLVEPVAGLPAYVAVGGGVDAAPVFDEPLAGCVGFAVGGVSVAVGGRAWAASGGALEVAACAWARFACAVAVALLAIAVALLPADGGAEVVGLAFVGDAVAAWEEGAGVLWALGVAWPTGGVRGGVVWTRGATVCNSTVRSGGVAARTVALMRGSP